MQTRFVLLTCCVFALLTSVAAAGMPSITMSDIGRMRLSTISFFCLLILLSAGGIRFLWAGLRRDVTGLPALSYRSAVFGVLLWGLVFVIVLTMISGARELMTPGAWVRNGFTYQPVSDSRPTSEQLIATELARQLNQQSMRFAALQTLGIALREFATEHDGAYPSPDEFRELPACIRELPGDQGVEYLYRESTDSPEVGPEDPVVALEPAIFADGSQLALYRSGLVGPLRSQP